MPSIELTENLRNTIKDLRKKKKKRGDDLSKEIGKGASYISQIENGKIKEIDFDLLDEIFHKITDLPENEYNEFINSLLDQTASHMTEKELQYEKWMYQFNYETRKFPIPDALVDFIRKSLSELNYTPEQFVEIINQNRGLENMSVEAPNKVNVEIIDKGNGDYGIFTYIKFDLPQNFISDILSKKMSTINFINMKGILFNIFISKGYSIEEAHVQTDTMLDENKFYTIEKRNKLIQQNIKEKELKNEPFTYYDVQPTDYDKQYQQLLKDITGGLNALRDRDILYACKRLEILSKNMHSDLGLSIALMSSPINKIPTDKRKDFWSEYSDLLVKYIKSDSINKSDSE